jgi:hypothetical protein
MTGFALEGRFFYSLNDHVQCWLHAQRAWQALCAASAGNQAQLHLRQRNIGAGSGNTVVAAQRQLQAAAHGHGVHGGHHRFGGVFYCQNYAE